MKKFRIKSGITEQEKKFRSLNDDLILKGTIQLQCKSLRGINDYTDLEDIRTWYVDEYNVLVPAEIISKLYDKVNE